MGVVCRLVVKKIDAGINKTAWFFKVVISYCFIFARGSHIGLVIVVVVVRRKSQPEIYRQNKYIHPRFSVRFNGLLP